MPVKVLIVEDIAFMRNIIVRSLEQQGITAIAADGAVAAMAQLHAHEDTAVVLTDLVMPGMNGDELFALCKQQLGDATPPFILLTASQDVNAMIEAKRHGFADVLIKPLDTERLMQSLQAIIPEQLRDLIIEQSTKEDAGQPEEDAAPSDEAGVTDPVADSEEQDST